MNCTRRVERQIGFVWVPGHAGWHLDLEVINDAADSYSAAKDALDLRDIS